MIRRTRFFPRRIAISFCYVCLFAASLGLLGMKPLKAQESTRVGKRPISIIVEEGSRVPSQPLAIVGDGNREASPIELVIKNAITLPNSSTSEIKGKDVTFNISVGNAHFATTEKVIALTKMKGLLIEMPEIIAGESDDESFVQVLIDGEVIIDNIRVATLPKGGIENLVRKLEHNESAIISLSTNYAIVDEANLTNIDDEAVTMVGDLPRSTERRPEKRPRNIADYQQLASGLCFRVFWGPGMVNWNISNPAGAGYSYKPEGPNSLSWASTPSNAIDGIYNRGWGCNVALKVPDSCTISVSSSSITSCCNATFAALGYVPQWVNPSNIGWVSCPLR